MMLKTPKEFEHVATEWAIKYAGAKPKNKSESSGGMTEEQLIARARARDEAADKTTPDRFACFPACFYIGFGH